jgi:hypothetical protein
MKRLIYWCCAILDDSRSYNIRAKTKREAADQRQRFGAARFGPPTKIVIEYRDAFDLMIELTGEGASMLEQAAEDATE